MSSVQYPNMPARPARTSERSYLGLTKREEFLKAILAGLCANPLYIEHEPAFLVRRAEQIVFEVFDA